MRGAASPRPGVGWSLCCGTAPAPVLNGSRAERVDAESKIRVIRFWGRLVILLWDSASTCVGGRAERVDEESGLGLIDTNKFDGHKQV